MKLFLLIVFFSTTCICHAQVDSAFVSNNANEIATSPLLVKQKFSTFGLDSIAKPPGVRMKRIGTGLTLIGGTLLISGIIVGQTSSSYEPAFSGDDESLTTTEIALGLSLSGIGMIIPGIISINKGSKKYNQYLKNQQITTTIQIKGNGLSLIYQF